MSLEQLNAAREVVQSDPGQFPTLVRGILKVGDRPEPAIRTWSAGFVADYFGSQEVSDKDKNDVLEEVLPPLTVWIKDETNIPCTKLAVSILCEIYPRIYEKTAAEGEKMKTIWDVFQVLKNMIMARWTPESPLAIRIMCIKMAQVIVTTHQKGHKKKIVNSSVMDRITLSAEAKALLDRLVSVFRTNSDIQFGELSASLNASVAVALAYPSLANEVIPSILSFNISKRKIAESSQLPSVLRWVSKLFKLSLHPLLKPFPQIQGFLAELSSYCNGALKRPPENPDNNYNGVIKSEAKRPRKSSPGENLPATAQPYKTLFTLPNGLANVDARVFQKDLAVDLAIAGLQKINNGTLNDMILKIKSRLEKVKLPAEVITRTTTTQDTIRRVKQVVADCEISEEKKIEEAYATGKPKGPSPAVLAVPVPPEFKQYDSILNRLLTEAPIRVIARLSARGLERGSPINEFTQKKLYSQLVSDFRSTLDSLVLWLSEEYYADESKTTYFKLVSRVVDEIIPKLEISDSKVFVRLLSELPELNREIIFKIKSSCLDPERTIVGARALKFLVMFKPPCREDCLDLIEELEKEGVQSVSGILQRYRPNKN